MLENKIGRPKKDKSLTNRNALIIAARSLFTDYQYDMVTTRKIAEKAKTDPALIRYYFGSKMGLFKSMIKETMEPILENLSKMENFNLIENAEQIMQSYYQTMANFPHFPKLIYHLACMVEKNKHDTISILLNEMFISININSIYRKNEKISKDKIESLEMTLLSIVSLIVFPFIMPHFFQERLGVNLSPKYLSNLTKHNINLLNNGILKNN